MSSQFAPFCSKLLIGFPPRLKRFNKGLKVGCFLDCYYNSFRFLLKIGKRNNVTVDLQFLLILLAFYFGCVGHGRRETPDVSFHAFAFLHGVEDVQVNRRYVCAGLDIVTETGERVHLTGWVIHVLNLKLYII